MRIVLMGQQAFAASVLDELIDRGREIVAVYGPPDDDARPPDPLTLAAVTVVLMTVALLAALFPALRASSVDPVRTIRAE